MMGPKYTIEAVTKELIDGLDDGSVVLYHDSLANIDVVDIEQRLSKAIQTGARQSRLLIYASLVIGLLCFFGGVLALLLVEKQALQAYHIGVGALIALLFGILLGFAFSTYTVMKTREEIAELRAYHQILTNMDPDSAARIATQIAARLPRQNQFQD